MLVFSACGRHEADSGKLSPSLTTVTSGTPFQRAVAARSTNAACVVVPVTGRTGDEIDSSIGREMAITGDFQPPTSLRNANSPATMVKVSGEDIGFSKPKPLLTPLVAVGLSPSLNLDARQAAQLVRLGEEFLAETDETLVTTPSSAATPTSTQTAPAENHARWLSAQEMSDQRFKSFFGYAAFNAQQILRSRQEYQAQQVGR